MAPESPGDLYDSTEIDEILALRVLTLTDEEKIEARGTDPRAAAIIDRCDDMPPEVWERMHGAVRALHPAHAEASGLDEADQETRPAVPWWDPEVDASVDPWSDSVLIGGVEVSKGSTVRLEPSHRADAQDLFLAGLTATVAGVFKDVDGSHHVAVTLDEIRPPRSSTGRVGTCSSILTRLIPSPIGRRHHEPPGAGGGHRQHLHGR